MSALAEKEMYGYELVEFIKRGRGLSVKDGTLYTILARLKAEGFIRHRWDHENNGPPRKYYTLTTSGQSTLREMHASWNEITKTVQRATKIKERRSES